MELRDYARGLRRHWLAIVMMILVGVGISFLWVRMQTPVYEASVDGIAKSLTESTDEPGYVQIGDPAASAKIPAFLVMADWPDVAQYAIEDLGLQATPEQLSTRVEVTNPTGTTILNVVARAESATGARALAESWIRGMVHTIDKIDGDGTEGSAPVNIVAGGSASLPSAPLFPDLRTSLIVGAVIGLGFGIGFALMRTASDRRVRAADDVEKKTEVSVVGTIPLAKQADVEARLFDPEASGSGPGFAVAEAMRALRTNLQFMDVDNPPRTIVVTSPLPGDGKSTIACNLALTLAASGSTVTLVDGDLRRSKVAETMGVTRGAGLSDVLAGRADVTDVLQRSPQAQNLYILAAGSAPPNPSEVLGSVRMKALLSDLAEHSIVIIDAPPLIPVTDGAVLTHQADGALLVVGLGKTTYDLVEKALDTLQKARGRALGIVLNKAPLKGVDASAYSYEYRRQYSKVQSSAPSRESTASAVAADEFGQSAPRKTTSQPKAPVESSFEPTPDHPTPAFDEDLEAYDPLSAFDTLIDSDSGSTTGAPMPTPRRNRARRS